MNLQSVLILGMGRSGKEAALLLKEKGVKVRVAERKNNLSITYKRKNLEKNGIEVFFGPHKQTLLEGVTLVVISPGIPLDTPLVKEAIHRRIPVISELELASHFLPREKLTAITGTNGKSTTCLLTYRILKRAGFEVALGGNIGVPLSRLARIYSPEALSHIVTEVSSFQLETTSTFSPHFYAILNISCDHLDRHLSLSRYRQIKALPLKKMRENDMVFLNFDQSQVASLKKLTKARVIFFSQYKKLKYGIFIDEDRIIMRFRERNSEISLKNLGVERFHSWENVLCAAGISFFHGVNVSEIEETLKTYKPLPHRQELVAKIKEVKFIDDSKATNEGAVKNLLNSLTGPAILIMGGKDKGSDFSTLRAVLPGKVKCIVAIGEARRKIKRQLGEVVPVQESPEIKDAVRTAFSWSEKGDSIILCPGCSSFDQFKSYRHRGNVFKKEVRRLNSDIRG